MVLTDAELQSIRAKLEKRQTFKTGVTELAAAASDAANQQGIFPLVARTHQLLKARHTNIDFWRAGSSLFMACQSLSFSSDELSKLRQFSADAHAFLKEDSEPGQVTGEPGNTESAQGQVTNAASVEDVAIAEQARILDMFTAPPPPESHYDDAGPIIDETSERWRRAQTSGTPAEGAEAAAAAGAAGQQRSRQQQFQALQRQILEGLQAVHSGMEAVTRGTESIERELDGVLGILAARQGAAGQSSRPPASKKVVANLPVVEATKEKLAEWGSDCCCAVCTCELVLGDQVQVLPCRHMYHPACVAPWLQKNNSCPTCRKELPTDDPHYEARKEKEAEEKVERRGAANARRGGEHMYI